MSFDDRLSIHVSPKLFRELESKKLLLRKPKLRVETWEELLCRLLKESKK